MVGNLRRWWKKLDNSSYGVFWYVVSRISGRTAAVLVALVYGGLGLLLPLALGWSVFWLVVANVCGTMLAGVVVGGWLAKEVQAGDRRLLVEWTGNLRNLNSAEFEWLVGEVFRREGWNVDETGHPDRADGNIDLELRRAGERRVVQCKRWWAQSVDVKQIREFAGTLHREHLPGNAGIFVALSDFTEQARTEAQEVGLALIDGRELYSRIDKLRAYYPCDICDKPMKLDRSSRGWWLRCVSAGCKGKRDLGNEPGRAVELLTRQPP